MRQLCAAQGQKRYLRHQFRDFGGRFQLEAKVTISGPDSYELGAGEKGFYDEERALTMMNAGRSVLTEVAYGTRHGTCSDWIGEHAEWHQSESKAPNSIPSTQYAMFSQTVTSLLHQRSEFIIVVMAEVGQIINVTNGRKRT